MNAEQKFQLNKEWTAIQKTAFWQTIESHIQRLIKNRQSACEKIRLIDQERVVAVAKAQGELEMLREVLEYPKRIIEGNILE